MKKADFINLVADKAGLTKKDSAKALDAVLEVVKETLVKGDSVSFIGFGSFGTAQRAAREGVIPGTKKKYTSPATRVVKFKVGKQLREAVAKKKAAKKK